MQRGLTARASCSGTLSAVRAVHRICGITLLVVQRAASAKYRKQKDELSPARRQELLDTVHRGIAPVGAMCTPCHAPQPALLDLSAVGYLPSRVAALLDSVIVRQVLSIEQGQPFYLPLEPGRQP